MNNNDNINKTFASNYSDKNLSDQTLYHCGICGKSYKTVGERAACETKCLAERKKAASKAEIEKKYKELVELINDYCKDYGSIQLGESHYFDDFPALSKLLGGWF